MIAYDDEHKAEEVRLALAKLPKEYLIDLDDAVVAVKRAEGKIKLNQAGKTSKSRGKESYDADV